MFFSRKSQIPWEVVIYKEVDRVPVSRWLEDDDFNIMRLRSADITGTYVFEVDQFPSRKQLKSAVTLAQQQLMQEIAKQKYNVLVSEGWVLTLYRRAQSYRMQIQYSGRPAYASGQVPSLRPPPFLIILDEDLSL